MSDLIWLHRAVTCLLKENLRASLYEMTSVPEGVSSSLTWRSFGLSTVTPQYDTSVGMNETEV